MQTTTFEIVMPRAASIATSASFVRATASREKCPFAGPGWLLAIARTNPAFDKTLETKGDARQDPELRRMERGRDRAGLFVAHDIDERPVAVEDDASRHLVDSHFVAAICSFGWLTRRCHTTAAKPSVCGVMRSLCTTGTSTHASATCLV